MKRSSGHTQSVSDLESDVARKEQWHRTQPGGGAEVPEGHQQRAEAFDVARNTEAGKEGRWTRTRTKGVETISEREHTCTGQCPASAPYLALSPDLKLVSKRRGSIGRYQEEVS